MLLTLSVSGGAGSHGGSYLPALRLSNGLALLNFALVP